MKYSKDEYQQAVDKTDNSILKNLRQSFINTSGIKGEYGFEDTETNPNGNGYYESDYSDRLVSKDRKVEINGYNLPDKPSIADNTQIRFAFTSTEPEFLGQRDEETMKIMGHDDFDLVFDVKDNELNLSKSKLYWSKYDEKLIGKLTNPTIKKNLDLDAINDLIQDPNSFEKREKVSLNVLATMAQVKPKHLSETDYEADKFINNDEPNRYYMQDSLGAGKTGETDFRLANHHDYDNQKLTFVNDVHYSSPEEAAEKLQNTEHYLIPTSDVLGAISESQYFTIEDGKVIEHEPQSFVANDDYNMAAYEAEPMSLADFKSVLAGYIVEDENEGSISYREGINKIAELDKAPNVDTLKPQLEELGYIFNPSEQEINLSDLDDGKEL